jgi:hypothetical protein
MKQFLHKYTPPPIWNAAERGKKLVERPFITIVRKLAVAFGYNIVRRQDYYSPLPVFSDLKKNVSRWNRPSSLRGVHYNLDSFKSLLQEMLAAYYDEFAQLPPYTEITRKGFGPGYTELDALTLYLMIRQHKPRRYLEIGSGVSTYYCSLAAIQNKKEGYPLQIQCIEPYPYKQLYTIPDIQVQATEVQNSDLSLFQMLTANDVLFVDSSHVVKIDGDVPFLLLEVLPALQPGVIIHIHDIPFPYNVPHPANYWVLERSWPVYWTEAMLLQAFLCFNEHFEIMLSLPILRYLDESYLRQQLPIYQAIADNPNTFSAIWLRRLGDK